MRPRPDAGKLNPITQLDALAVSDIPAEHQADIPRISEQLGGLNRLNDLNQLRQVTDLVAVTGLLPGLPGLGPVLRVGCWPARPRLPPAPRAGGERRCHGSSEGNFVGERATIRSPQPAVARNSVAASSA